MESQATNPYQSPEAQLSTQTQSEPNQSGVFSMTGRIGRLRYLAYFMCIYLVIMLLVAIVSIIAAVAIPALGENNETAGGILGILMIFVIYVPMLFYGFVYAVRRLNDCGWSGWLSLLFIIPIANIVLGLILLFKRGDEGVNQYGAQPRPNSTAVKVAAFFGLILPATVGVLAAIALPAYQDYVQRAQAAQFNSGQ